MRIVIASGKGGAGKTTVTACLAGQWERDLLLVDADVEAPNLHLLLHPNLAEPEPVYLEVPELVEEKCTGCGAWKVWAFLPRCQPLLQQKMRAA